MACTFPTAILWIFIWEAHVKQLAYAAEMNNGVSLHQRVTGACETIRHLERIRLSMI